MRMAFRKPAARPGRRRCAAPAVPAVVLISYDYWQRRFGGKPDVLGKSLPAGGPGGTQIVGVLAPGFELLFPPDTNTERLPDIWFALRIPYDNVNRNQVQHRVDRAPEGRCDAGPGAVRGRSNSAETRKNFLISGTAGYAIRLEPMHAHVVEEVRPALLALMGAVVFLLLIACANVANLLLVRASLRERELAVRTAMGGSRWALVRQTLAEAAVLAFAGAGLGLALAYAGISELRALAPPSLPRLDTIAIDPVVIAFTAAAALVAAGTLRHRACLARLAPRCRHRTARQQPHHRSGECGNVAQRSGGRRSGALLRTVDRQRTDGAQLPGTSAHRSRFRFRATC